MKKSEVFFMIFQGLSVGRNCLRPEKAPLTISDIKRGLLCDFAKSFKSRHFMGQSSMGFQLLLNSKSSKLLKNTLKISILNLKKRTIFSNSALVSHYSITKSDILIFCNILHLEMNFGNLY